MINDLEKFRHTLPYATESLGIYQPILGWRSKRTINHILAGFADQETALFRLASRLIYPNIAADFTWVRTGTVANPEGSLYNPAIKSILADILSKQYIAPYPFTSWTSQWEKLLSRENLDAIMATQEFMTALGYWPPTPTTVDDDIGFRRESIVAGVLNQLAEKKLYSQLVNLFSPPADPFDLETYLALRQFADPLENFDPKTDFGKVGLSPVGLVHLFRQYFFEFDSFLGPAVQHVWLSPGGTVELIEINTRKTTIERAVEQSVETVLKSEKSTMDQDEISDAVKQDNESNTKLGASVSANERWGWGDANERASVEFDQTQKQAREDTHKQTRQQSAKVSSEIKTNFKSTFRTVTETTDTTSKRYLLQNTTDKLVNYELRRKMRRVGVQVQDLGTQVCWQSYVDDPGRSLGVAKLVHLAAPPDFSSLGPVNEIPLPDEYSEDLTGSFNLPPDEHSYTGWNQWMKDIELKPKAGFECYSVGELHFTSGGSVDVEIVPNRDKQDPGRTFPPEAPATLPLPSPDPAPGELPGAIYRLTLYLRGGHSEHGGDLMQFTIPLRYRPLQAKIQEIQGLNKSAKDSQTAQKDQATREAYITAARDRIKAASNIQPRPYDGLREEERIVVYRNLLHELMDVGVDLTSDPRVLHKVSELLNAMFDIDAMLYFVAPEWWRPRMHIGRQSLAPELMSDPVLLPPKNLQVAQFNLQIRRKPSGLDEHVVGWGGVDDSGRDDYYITEDSAPARLGSSLGWLLQLDGDNLRNAFLNAPWVKAVVPIRPGKELDALNWLSRTEIEDKDGLCDFYVPASAGEAEAILAKLKGYPWSINDTDDICPPENPSHEPLLYRYQRITAEDLTVMDALRYLAIMVKAKYLQGQEKVTEDLGGGITLSYLPPDRVYEYGFDPLVGGFTAEPNPNPDNPSSYYPVFDQWVEVLPTDQVVAVQVEYDPKTGQLI